MGTLQSIHAVTEAAADANQVAQDGPLRVGESLPAVMRPADMMRAFAISRATFYGRVNAHWYDALEIQPRRGRRTWSGSLVQRVLNGERVGFTFGRKRSA